MGGPVGLRFLGDKSRAECRILLLLLLDLIRSAEADDLAQLAACSMRPDLGALSHTATLIPI
jgi:hypothetical protein